VESVGGRWILRMLTTHLTVIFTAKDVTHASMARRVLDMELVLGHCK